MQFYLVLLGLPGAGKGTQARRLAEDRGWLWISTGEMLRRIAREDSDLGRRVRTIMEEGRLVDDQTVFDVVRHEIERHEDREGVVLDGFPRNLNQTKILESYLKARGDGDRLRAVLLDVPENVVVERLSSRRSCPQCGAVYNLMTRPSKLGDRCEICQTELIQRSDDKPEIIRKRLLAYHESTEPLMTYFRERGILYIIRADVPEDEVYRALEALIDTWQNDALHKSSRSLG